MKGDFSRLTFNPRKHYTSVLHQQGRVWLDADWNEHVLDQQHLLEQETIDVVGRCGVPLPGTAFQITAPDPTAPPDDFRIGGGLGSSGHFYIDGLLCVLEESTTYHQQRDYPNPPSLTMPTAGNELTVLVYLEAWQRLVTYLEDDSIREVALAGPDTTARLKTIAQVKVIVVQAGTTCANAALPGPSGGTLSSLQPVDTLSPGPCHLPDPSSFTGRENHLYRVEVHDGGDVAGVTGTSAFSIPLAETAGAGSVTLALSEALNATRRAALESSGAVVLSDDDGRVERVPLGAISANGLTIGLARGLISAFETGRNAVVTGGVGRFKWSRDNASFAVPITGIDQTRRTVTLASLGRDQATSLRQGDLVEIIDDVSELRDARGFLTYLSANPDPDLFRASLADALPADFSVPISEGPSGPTTPDRHLILRRWDGLGSASAASPEDLGDGVRVQFGGSNLQPGDYWQFSARAIDGSIETLTNAPPKGIVRHQCPLAIVRFTMPAPSPPGSSTGSPPVGSPPGEARPIVTIEDCRKTFPPLTDINEPGVHVTQVFGENANSQLLPIRNDTNIQVADISNAIHVDCDRFVAVGTAKRPTAFVTVEVPFPFSVEAAGVPAAYQSVTLAATHLVANNRLSWFPTEASRQFMQQLRIPQGDPGILARLILKGNFIWAADNPYLFLDGNTFGFRQRRIRPLPDGIFTRPGFDIGLRPDFDFGIIRSTVTTQEQPTLVRLPSGDQKRGGDFEMWFWLRPPAVVGPFTLALGSVTAVLARGEGITELMPDIVLIGANGAPTEPTANVPQFNIEVTLGTTITSQPVTEAPVELFRDVVLLIDDPVRLDGSQLRGTVQTIPGRGATGLDYRNGDAPNVILGASTSNNTVVFSNVSLDSPAAGQNRILRIKNLRANMSALGISVAAIPTQLIATVRVTRVDGMQIFSQQVPLAFVQPATSFQVRNARAGNEGAYRVFTSQGVNVDLARNKNRTNSDITFFLVYTESFAAAFKTKKAVPVNPAEISERQETAFDNRRDDGTPLVPVQRGEDPGSLRVGVVNSGTRFRAIFQNVPLGFRLFVTTRDVPANAPVPLPSPNEPPSRAVLVTSEDQSGAGGAFPQVIPPPGTEGAATAGIPIAELPVINGSAVGLWEWIANEGPTVPEEVRFGVVLAAAPENLGTAPALGTSNVIGSLAPTSTEIRGSFSAPEPRFIDIRNLRPAFVLEQGTTNLLFPFVTGGGFVTDVTSGLGRIGDRGISPIGGPGRIIELGPE